MKSDIVRLDPIIFLVSTEQVYRTTLRTPGESRFVNEKIFEEGIINGVRIGEFGLGELKNDVPVCNYFKEEIPGIFVFLGNEIIINQEICRKQKKEEEEEGEDIAPPYTKDESGEKSTGDEGSKEEGEDIFVTPSTEQYAREMVYLKFKIPKGRIYDILRTMNLLQSKFNALEIKLNAKDGSISEQVYENIIKKTFRQLDIDVEENAS